MLTHARFQEQLYTLLPAAERACYILAVSGGADSMVMLFLFKKLGLNVRVAHINYKLRGKDSDEDQRVVQEFCIENDIPFHLYEVSEKDAKPDNSIQLWARELRYDFFRKIKAENQADYIVTAHHLNDQLETFIINLSKAAGLKGLSGIPANSNEIIRPLLKFSKEEIYAFAAENNIPFREDLSNQKNDYLRNFIRNEISPKLRETNDNFLQNFNKSLNHLEQTRKFLEERVTEIEEEIFSQKDHFTLIDKEKLSRQSSIVIFEILRKFGFENKTEIAKILDAETGKVFKSATHQLKVDRQFFVLNLNSSELEPENGEIIIAKDYGENHQVFNLNKIYPEFPNCREFRWKIDADKIAFPLKIRRKKEGDEFYPTGMSGRKKVAKFFKDEKMPTFVQQEIWLLCDATDSVLGVIPYRQDRRFLADQSTSKFIVVTL